MAILGASFLLLWACDVAQLDIPQTLALAVVALIAVLPEYAVDMTTVWPWLAFNLFVLILLALDLGVLHRKAHEVGVREALWLSLGYLVLALGFAWGVFHFQGARAGTEFLTGYLIEKSLSVDNIFVFLLIFRHFEVPGKLRHTVLFWGVLGALVMDQKQDGTPFKGVAKEPDGRKK